MVCRSWSAPATIIRMRVRRQVVTDTAAYKQVADNLVKAVGLGLSYKDAAAVAGIGKSTFHEWKKRAEIAERSNKYTVFDGAY